MKTVTSVSIVANLGIWSLANFGIFHYSDSIRVMEEVSCSEEDVEEAPVAKKPATNANVASKESVEKEKKKISPPAGKKQGSILSFFSKK